MGSLDEIGSAVKAYVKKQKVLLALLTATGGGLGTWVYNIQETLNYLKSVPQMYEDIETLKKDHAALLEKTESDHKRAQLDSMSYSEMKDFLKDLPRLYMKAEVMEGRFNKVEETTEDLEDKINEVEDDVRYISRRNRNLEGASF